MGESSFDDLSRYKDIKTAVVAARNLGVTDVSKRRELVIDAKGINKKIKNPWITPQQAEEFPSVSKSNIRDEDPRTIATAIHKYFEIYGGQHSKSPVMIEVLHSAKPNDSEVGRVKKDTQVGDTNKLKQKHEVGTREMANEISDIINAPVLIARKSRIWADLNRIWYKKTIEGELKTTEFSRSGKAAQYLAYRQLLQSGEHLNNNEQISHPYLSLSIHGMKDHQSFGFAIAGGVESASSEVITWFQESLTKALAEVAIYDNVKIDRIGDYSGLPSLVNYRQEPEKVEDRHHPSFGVNFNKIQLEIDKRYREGENRKKVVIALSKVLKEFEEKFI
jgi:hypothetical protein